jgi:hypothetical protein
MRIPIRGFIKSRGRAPAGNEVDLSNPEGRAPAGNEVDLSNPEGIAPAGNDSLK